MINTFVEEKWQRKKKNYQVLMKSIFNDNGNTENGKPC